MENTPPSGKSVVPIEGVGIVPADGNIASSHIIPEWRQKPGKTIGLSLSWFALLGFGWEMINNNEYAVAELLFLAASCIFFYQIYASGARRVYKVLALIFGLLVFGGSVLDGPKIKAEKPWSNIFAKAELLTPSVELTYDPQTHAMNFFNRGTSNIYLWGSKFGGGDSIEPKDLSQPRELSANGGTYHIFAEPMEDEIRSKAANRNIESRVPYWVFVTMDDKKERILKYELWIRFGGGQLRIETQNLGAELKQFTH